MQAQVELVSSEHQVFAVDIVFPCWKSMAGGWLSLDEAKALAAKLAKQYGGRVSIGPNAEQYIRDQAKKAREAKTASAMAKRFLEEHAAAEIARMERAADAITSWLLVLGRALKV
jgi:hypothetical protein